MVITPEEAKANIEKLIAQFASLGSAARKLNEANTKKDYIEPLFARLGWDVYDSNEVSAEERASDGRVDYAFKLHGVSQFYLEAKPPRADLSKLEYAKQAITYTYNKGITWAVLTDFEELKVFNGQTGRAFLTFSYPDYLTRFEDLWLLSRESFEKNALNEKAEKYGALPPRLRIEQRLYDQLRQWREELFTQLHLYNKHLTLNQVDEVIQRLFNRLIFIRTCEDRGIEEKVLLSTIHEWHSSGCKGELIEVLQRIFRDFDGYYNSDLFMLHLTDQVFIESTLIEKIIKGLYELPKGMASYDFSIIDADVLGAVYEQYLGHVAAIAKRRVAEAQMRMDLGFPAEEVFELAAKRQKRREHGIYYTPKFVVDYIVRETVGRLLQERSDHEIRNIKILDMACGSGSFLIRAYDELLNYHAAQRSKPVLELDQWERLPILTGNIFGVDLDMQAVEIARLNLLIRSLAQRETLPSLANNVRQGNSLISGAKAELRPYFGDRWREKKPFNWEEEFDTIMGEGGFDVVIGNPPYVRIQSLPREDANYYREKYESAFGSFDIYVLFLEKAVELLKPGGRLGFITSGKFLKAEYGKRIQQLLHEKCVVENIVDLSAQQVFADATTYPAIVVLRKGEGDEPLRYTSVPASLLISSAIQPIDMAALPSAKAAQEAVVKGFWPPVSAEGDSLLEKLSAMSEPLGKVADRIFQGLVTGADKVFIVEKRGEPNEEMIRVFSLATSTEHELEMALLKPLLTGKNVSRYYSLEPRQLLLFPYRISHSKASLIDESTFASQYPNAWVYLEMNRKTLEQREGGRFQGRNWYAFSRTQNLAIHDQPKLAIPSTVKRLLACYDYSGNLYLDNVRVNGILLKEGTDSNYKYVTGLMNSRLLHWFFTHVATAFANGWFGANRQFIEPLPIRNIDFNNLEEKKMHDDLVALIDRMLELNKRLAPIRNTPCNERDELMRKIERTDGKIDNLVYELYGLTEEEREIVDKETESGGS